MANAYSIAYQRDEAGVKAVSCSCGWRFSCDHFRDNLPRKKRADTRELDTAIADHERQHANGRR